MKRALCKVSCFLPLLLLLSGCWGRNEVNDIGIVTATGIDTGDHGEIRLYLLLAVPRLVGTSSMNGGSESKLSTSAGWVVSEDGRTIMDAYRNIQGKLPRKIFFSHNRVVIIGEKVARQGLMPILDFFERNRQSQLNSYVLISKSNVVDALEFKPKFEKLASEIMKEELKVKIGTSVHLGRFLQMMMESGEEPYAPEILIKPSKVDEDSANGPLNLVTSLETAVFKQDKLIGWLTHEETRGLKWIQNEMKEGVITAPIPEELGSGKASAEIIEARAKSSPCWSRTFLNL
nr:Ger(x)C family spore germination protein [Paenibacillus sp. YPD9-1]